MAKRKATRAKWAALVSEYEQGSESQADFASRHQINKGTFQKWLYKLRREVTGQQSVQFVEIAGDVGVAKTQGIEIAVGRSVRLKLPAGAEPRYLAELVCGLVNAGC